MKFIEPRGEFDQEVPWKVSKHTRYVVSYYAKYVNRSENEVVDRFLKCLLEDSGFTAWIHAQRRSKRMLSRLFPDGGDEQK